MEGANRHRVWARKPRASAQPRRRRRGERAGFGLEHVHERLEQQGLDGVLLLAPHALDLLDDFGQSRSASFTRSPLATRRNSSACRSDQIKMSVS